MIVRVLVKRGVDRRYRLEKSWHFGKFAGRNHKTTNRRDTVLSLDLWFRQQLWLQLWKGPGAVSTYLSMPVSLILCRPWYASAITVAASTRKH
jgi:hypothetical protein